MKDEKNDSIPHEEKETCFFCDKELDTVRFCAIINGERQPFCNKYCYAAKNKSKESSKIMIR